MTDLDASNRTQGQQFSPPPSSKGVLEAYIYSSVTVCRLCKPIKNEMPSFAKQTVLGNSLTKCSGGVVVPSFTHKVVNLSPSLLVNDWPLQGCICRTQSCNYKHVYLWNVPDRFFGASGNFPRLCFNLFETYCWHLIQNEHLFTKNNEADDDKVLQIITTHSIQVSTKK